MENKEILQKIEDEIARLAIEYKRHAELHKRNARKWLIYMFITIGVYIAMMYFLSYPLLCGL
jgi:hypothetical protein